MKLHWPACGLPYPPVVLSSPPALPEKNPPPPPYSRVIARISRLCPRKWFLLVSKMTPMATIRTPPRRSRSTEFCSEQFRREITSPRVLFGEEITAQGSRVAFVNMCVCARCLWREACASASHTSPAQNGKIRRREKTGSSNSFPWKLQVFLYSCASLFFV